MNSRVYFRNSGIRNIRIVPCQQPGAAAVDERQRVGLCDDASVLLGVAVEVAEIPALVKAWITSGVKQQR